MRSNTRRGAAGQQYAIVVGLIGVVALFAVSRTGGTIDGLFTRAANVLTHGSNAIGGGGGTTTVAVNQPPVAGAVTLAGVLLGQSGSYAAATLLAASSDPDGTALTLTAVGSPSSGTVTLSGGQVTFTPAATGAQSFQFTVSDGAATATATASVAVTLPNQAPTAPSVTLAGMTLGGGATYAAAAVLANASDPEGQPLTLTAVGSPSSGTVSLNAGTVTFTPTGSGAQSFSYTVSDGSLTATGTANVSVGTAASCKALKTADASLSGVAVRTIRPASSDISVLCDFTTLGGGWTLVAIQFESDPVTNWNEGRQGDYDPDLSTSRSFALVSAEIPTHTHTAFGRAQSSGGTITTAMIDSIPFTYSTGNIAVNSYASDSTPTRNYWVHRNTTSYYNNHDPNSTGGHNSAIWNNTLTFNLNDASAESATWAFSPNHGTQAYRGFAYGGSYTTASSEAYGWAVWVK